MPKPDEVGRRHAAVANHGGASLGHATHHFTCQGALAPRGSQTSGWHALPPQVAGRGFRGIARPGYRQTVPPNPQD